MSDSRPLSGLGRGSGPRVLADPLVLKIGKGLLGTWEAR